MAQLSCCDREQRWKFAILNLDSARRIHVGKVSAANDFGEELETYKAKFHTSLYHCYQKSVHLCLLHKNQVHLNVF